MTKDETRHCHYTGDSGIPCKAHPLEGRKYCFFHDPAMKKKRAAAGRRGGLMRGQRALTALKLPADMFTRPLETPCDAADLLRETIARFCRGEIDARLAEMLTYMTNSLLYAWNRASQQDEWPALQSDSTDSTMDSFEDESVNSPETEEAVIELLQRTLVEARSQAEPEAGRE